MRIQELVLAVTLVVIFAGPAMAQDTISLYFDDPVTGLQRFGRVPGTTDPFHVVVVLNTDAPACAAEFVMTEVAGFPGVFKTNTTKIHDTPLDLGNNGYGEYMMAWGFDGCPSGEFEVVRVEYRVLTPGMLQHPVVLSLRGFGPGDSRPSSFLGEMGYIDAADDKVVLTPEVWSEYGLPDNENLEGAVVLNPNWMPIAADTGSVSAFKTRY